MLRLQSTASDPLKVELGPQNPDFVKVLEPEFTNQARTAVLHPALIADWDSRNTVNEVILPYGRPDLQGIMAYLLELTTPPGLKMPYINPQAPCSKNTPHFQA